MRVPVLGVIPARYAAQRFPGKPLALIAGRPLLQRVHERACQARSLDALVVATDDARIADLVRGFGGEVVLTSPACPSGTDRVAEVARQRDAAIIVNIQGDEPLLAPALVDELVAGLVAEPACGMATVARVLTDPAELANPNVVKVVRSLSGRALYFSRQPIPFTRDAGAPATHYKHLGLYAYRRETLARLVTWPVSALERAEKLEQLRALEHDVAIQVIVTAHDSIGVDTPADVQRVEQALVGQP